MVAGTVTLTASRHPGRALMHQLRLGLEIWLGTHLARGIVAAWAISVSRESSVSSLQLIGVRHRA